MTAESDRRIRLGIVGGGRVSGTVQGHGFATDGAAMTFIACQNPSLTCMATTARAAVAAAERLKEGQL